MMLLTIENHFSSLMAIGFLFGTAVNGQVEEDVIDLATAEKNQLSMAIDSEDMMNLMGYKKEIFYKCKREDWIASLAPEHDLKHARRECDHSDRCKGIYSPNCSDTGETKILCKGKPVRNHIQRDSCYWMKDPCGKITCGIGEQCINGECRCGNTSSCAGRITGSFCDSERSKCKCSVDKESCPDGLVCKNGLCEENPDCMDNEIWCQYIDTKKFCSNGLIREKCAGACKTCEVNSLWPEEVKDRYCPKIDAPIDVVSSQQECQQKCIKKSDCVGILYGLKDINSGYCYVSKDDYLAFTYDDLGFYRRPEMN